MSAENNISFEMPKNQSSAIKVIGVGGGGSNAVNHMFSQDIYGVDFVICNTDAQALENSPVPNKIQLGAHLTSGLGAGANPEIGAQSASESLQEIQQMLSSQTKMIFITAGMGGGTGTGAAPIIARIAKDMDVLVVGIVTTPFSFEGKMRSKQAQKGVDELRNNVDSLIVINNNKLREVYGNLGITAGYSKADEVLSTAAKGIAEVITSHYKQNIDLHDAKTVLSNSGTAIMGSAVESGDDRAKKAIVGALDSPLLNDNKITGAKNVLLLIVSGNNEVTLDEIGEINDYIQEEAGYEANIIMGVGEDPSLEDAVSLTVIATGFAADQQHTITNTDVKKIVHTLEGEQKATYNFEDEENFKKSPTSIKKETPVIYDLGDEEKKIEHKIDLIPTTELIKNIDVVYDEIALEEVSEEDFIITNVEPPQEIDEVSIEQETVQQNLFDLPIKSNEKKEEPKLQQQPKKEEKRFVLEDNFDIKPTIKNSSEPEIKPFVEESLRFKVSTREVADENQKPVSKEVSPHDLTVSELKKHADERRSKMKQFNHKFNDSVFGSIEDIERQPAYKRLGVNVDIDSKISQKEIVLKKDNSDFNLSDNSFLHDNVD